MTQGETAANVYMLTILDPCFYCRNNLFDSFKGNREGSTLASAVKTCGRCLFASLDTLASASPPLPLIERVDLSCMAEEVMIDALWQCSPKQLFGDILNPHTDTAMSMAQICAASVISSLVSSANAALQDACIDRLAHTITSIQNAEGALFPFSLKAFAVQSTSIGGDKALFGKDVVNGIIYSNSSDRWTNSCGIVSSALPIQWDNVNYLREVRKQLEALRMPAVPNNTENEWGGNDYSAYAGSLSRQGWTLSNYLGHQLDEAVFDLDQEIIALKTCVINSMTSQYNDEGWDANLGEQWEMVNMNFLRIKRLLSRVISIHCETVGKDVLSDDAYLLLHANAASNSYRSLPMHDIQPQTKLFSLPPLEMAEESENRLIGSDSGYKRPLASDHFEDHVVALNRDSDENGEAIFNSTSDCEYEQSVSKKSRLYDNSVSIGDNTEENFDLGTVDDFRQLRHDCHKEIEESILFEEKLAQTLVGDYHCHFSPGPNDIGGLCNENYLSRSDVRDCVPFRPAKENINANLSTIDILRFIDDTRADRENTDLWMSRISNY